MDYTWLFFGVFGGLIFGIIFIGVGYALGRTADGDSKGHNQGELPPDDSDGDLLFKRSGYRCGNNRCNIPISQEEIAVVLQMIRHTFDKNLSQHEKECIEAAIEVFDREPPEGEHDLRTKILALNALRSNAGWYEKNMIDEIADDMIELDAIKFLRENENENDSDT